MLNITSSAKLKETILILEAESKNEWNVLKFEMYQTIDLITPLNILKYIFEDIIDAINIKEKITLVTMTLVKKMLHFLRKKTNN